MQVTLDLVDWEWAASAPDAHYFVETMLEDDDADSRFGTSCYDVPGGWGDSAMLYLDVCDAFPAVVRQMSESGQGRCLEQGLSAVLSPDRKTDELGLQPLQDEGYLASVSPAAVAAMADACSKLEPHDVAVELDRVMRRDSREQGDRVEQLRAYLEQWIVAVRTAAEERKGILVHIG